MDRSHVPIARWTTATLRMTCLTGGRTPCSAATGIPGRRATSLSPMCGARAAPMKASPGTPLSGARQRLPLSLVPPAALPARLSVLPRHRWGAKREPCQPTQGDREPTEAFDTRQLPGIQLQSPTSADRQDLVRIEGSGFKSLSFTEILQVSGPVRLSQARLGAKLSSLIVAAALFPGRDRLSVRRHRRYQVRWPAGWLPSPTAESQYSSIRLPSRFTGNPTFI